MNEDVAASIPADEAEALAGAEPLHRATKPF